MTSVQRDVPDGTDVLIRKVNRHLAAIRGGLRGGELDLAERLADCLRELVLATAAASAADRARVRAAVHHFVWRRDGRGHVPPVRSLAATQQVVNKVVVHLGRPDLLVAVPSATASPQPPSGPVVLPDR
jgi:hypothetical protein